MKYYFNIFFIQFIMTLDDLKNIISAHRQELLEKYYIKSIGVFGSYARGEQTEESDVDLLVEFNTEIDFFLIFDLEEYISKLLNKKVEVFTENTLKPFVLPYVKNDFKKVA